MQRRVRTVSRPLESDSPSRALSAAAFVLVLAGLAGAEWAVHPHSLKFSLIDLAVYRAAGNAVLHGHSMFGSYVADQLRVRLPFIYPPIAAVLAIPFTLLPTSTAKFVWTLISVVLLVAVVRLYFAPLLDRFRTRRVALVVAVLAMAGLSPVVDNLRFGQLGIILMACCVFDCVDAPRRWPRGVLIGLAAAVKLVPAIFIPYLVLTRRLRAAAVASATFFALTLIGFVVTPSDSSTFWAHRVFEPTSPTFFSNQSLEGLLQRAIGPWRLVWLPAVAVVVAFGLWRAAVASHAGHELRAVALVGLTGVLISPISWIHHLVWIIPVVAVVVGDGSDRRRTALAFVIAALFIARVPYIGNDELHGTGLAAGLLEDAYGCACVGLLLYLGDAVPVFRRVLAQARARSHALQPGGVQL